MKSRELGLLLTLLLACASGVKFYSDSKPIDSLICDNKLVAYNSVFVLYGNTWTYRIDGTRFSYTTKPGELCYIKEDN